MLSRRDFLHQSSAWLGASTATWTSLPDAVPASAGYALYIMATNWGFNGSIDDFCKKAKAEGYDGVEVWMPGDEKDRQALSAAVTSQGLKLALLYGGGDRQYATHREQFLQGIQTALGMKPIYVNCHSGKDYFSFEQNKALIEESYTLASGTGIPLYHETHRGRSLFAAHVTRNFLEKMPNLRLTLDVSHWCNVHESLLGDQPETMALVLPKVEHIHARVGHAEGPQVNDPRAPEWEQAVKVHLAWWDSIVNRKRSAGQPMTILTEFGPPDYLPTLPYTRQPLASQWDINVYMMHLLRKRYA